MSAVTWESVAPAESLAPRRRHLTSVPTVPAVADRRLESIRLTRSGRLAITLGIALAASIGAGWAIVAPAAAPEAGAVVTVQAGDTLSGIVAAQRPDLDLGVGIAAVVELNDLPNAHVRAGQVLVMPKG